MQKCNSIHEEQMSNKQCRACLCDNCDLFFYGYFYLCFLIDIYRSRKEQFARDDGSFRFTPQDAEFLFAGDDYALFNRFGIDTYKYRKYFMTGDISRKRDRE